MLKKEGRARSPTKIDRLVGSRLKDLRKRRGLTQSDLALPLGISFQQLQKYETGVNRISAGMIASAAEILDASVSDFFSDMPEKPKLDSTTDDLRRRMTKILYRMDDKTALLKALRTLEKLEHSSR